MHVASWRGDSSAWAWPRCASASAESRRLRVRRAPECSRADAMALRTSRSSCRQLESAGAWPTKLRYDRQLARTQELFFSIGSEPEG